MAIRDRRTFDPYSLMDLTPREALKSAFSTFRTDKMTHLALAVLATIPALIALFIPEPLSTLIADLALVLFLGVSAPTLARRVTGLSMDLRGTLRVVGSKIPAVISVTAGVSLLLAAPAVGLHGLGTLAALGGVFLGIVLATPFILAVPVIVMEGVGAKRAARRSLTLVRGRLMASIPWLGTALLVGVTPGAVRLLAPDFAVYTLVVQPALLAFCGIAIGSLYASLYDY